jgi:hypothetical protein
MKAIENLKPGDSIKISECNGIECTAERSGDGKVLRFVRHFQNGSFEVFHQSKF